MGWPIRLFAGNMVGASSYECADRLVKISSGRIPLRAWSSRCSQQVGGAWNYERLGTETWSIEPAVLSEIDSQLFGD